MATKRTTAPAKTNTEVLKTGAATPAPRTVSTSDIATRAYEIWRASGGGDGHDQADWFQAERELRQRATLR